MNSLRDMNDRRQQWMNEKPQFDGGIELRLRTNDLAILQFISNGEDGDRFIKVYRSHAFQTQGNNGPRTVQRYCPLQNGDVGIECPYCAQGHVEIKERMSIWMYVYSILHTQLPEKMPEGKIFPQVTYEGRIYFNEEVNDFKIWHGSAWRESPWADIIKLNEIYKGLNNFTCQMTSTGAGMQKRYKIYAMPQSAALSPEQYTAAQEKCTSIPQLLRDQLASPVIINPQMQQQNQPANNQAPSAPGIMAFAPPGMVPAAPPAWSPVAPVATAPVATAPAAFLTPPPAVVEQPPAPAAMEQPVAPVAAAPTSPPEFHTGQPTTGAPAAAATAPALSASAGEDNQRPLRSMF